MDLERIEKYRSVKLALEMIKKEELELRLEILEDLFPSASAGTFNEHLGEYKVKGTFRNNINIDADAYFDYEDQMTDAERCCVKLKPSIVLANFKNLEAHQATGLLEDIVTIKPGLPSLSIELEI